MWAHGCLCTPIRTLLPAVFRDWRGFSYPEAHMIILGVILLILGYLLLGPILVTIGWIVLGIGLVLFLLGAIGGREIAGRRYWF